MDIFLNDGPDDFVGWVRARAKRNRRSLEDEVVAVLRQRFAPGKLSASDAYREVQRLGLRTGPEATAMIREDRRAH